MSERESLKPCPGCAGTNLVVNAYGIEREDETPEDRSHEVVCDDCGWSGPEVSPRDAAIAAWNRRASLSTEPMAQEGGEDIADLRHRCAASNMHDHDGCACTDADLRARYSASPAPAQQGGEVEAWPPLVELGRVLGFFASAIKCGEAWTATCQAEYDRANLALQTLYAHPVAPSEEATVSEAEIEAAEAAYFGRHERGFIMKPLIPDEQGRRDMRSALLAALQTRSKQP